jgi:hypothetical protein
MGMMPMYWRWLQVRQILSAEKCMLNNTSMRHAAALRPKARRAARTGTLCISIKVVPTIWLCKHTMHECSQQTAALTPCTTQKRHACSHQSTNPGERVAVLCTFAQHGLLRGVACAPEQTQHTLAVSLQDGEASSPCICWMQTNSTCAASKCICPNEASAPAQSSKARQPIKVVPNYYH